MAHRRKAITLIEVIAVLAIILLLAALLVPAVHAAREAARQTQGRNNLRQMGEAVQVYDNTHRSFRE